MILMSENQTTSTDIDEMDVALSDARLIEDVRRGNQNAYGS